MPLVCDIRDDKAVKSAVAAGADGLLVLPYGNGADEKGFNEKTNKQIVAVDPTYFRPTEVETLLGDPSKAKQKLGWEPEITFQELVTDMVKHDLIEAKKDHLCQTHGFNTFDYNE